MIYIKKFNQWRVFKQIYILIILETDGINCFFVKFIRPSFSYFFPLRIEKGGIK